MKRINFYLPEKQIKELQKKAKKLGISASELLRRILTKEFNHKETHQRWQSPDGYYKQFPDD